MNRYEMETHRLMRHITSVQIRKVNDIFQRFEVRNKSPLVNHEQGINGSFLCKSSPLIVRFKKYMKHDPS
jgi:hypothetical protein